MFGSQQDAGKNQTVTAKQLVSVKAGTERRQRQLMSLRHKTQSEKLKHLRGEVEDDEDGTGGADGNGETTVAEPMNIWSYNAESKPGSIPVVLLPQFVELAMNGQTRDEVYHATIMIRKLLSVEKDPPYNAVTSSGVVPRLIQFLERADEPQLQFEAAWALTNIAAGTSENTVLLVSCGAIPRFVALLASPSADCRDQSAWAIGNLAGEGAECRDEALRNGAMPALLTLLVDASQPLNVLRNATWAASNLCRCKPQPALEQVAMALPVFAQLLHHEDAQLVTDAAWGISYVSDGPRERVQAVLETGALPSIVQLLSAPSNNLKTPAIRTIGNIATGDDDQTQMVLNAGALPPMTELLRNPKRALRKETCWTVSNIAAGPVEQIRALIGANIFIAMMDCLRAPELDVRKEAVWSVANVTMCGTVEDMQYLVNIGSIPPLCDTLRTYDPKIVSVALEALQCFLQIGEDARQSQATDDNVVARQVQECGGIDSLENLQKHTNKNVYMLALNILETYFVVDEGGAAGGVGGADFGAMAGEHGFDENEVDLSGAMGGGQPFSF